MLLQEQIIWWSEGDKQTSRDFMFVDKHQHLDIEIKNILQHL